MDITLDQLEKLVSEASAKGAEAAVRAINTVDPAERPGGAGVGANVNFNRPQRPSITRAIRAMRRGSWKGAELERDLGQATRALFGNGLTAADKGEESDESGNDGFALPTSVYAYAHVLEETAIRTDASSTKLGQMAIRAGLGEGNALLTPGSALVPIQYLQDEWVLALTSAIVMRNMPEVQVVPVNSNVVELPRESAAAAAASYAENATLTPNDPTLAVQEFQIRKQARLQLFSNELLADSNPAIDRVVMQMLARDIALIQDSQYLEGTGSSNQITGLSNYSGLTTSSWTAATNGSTPGGDDLVKLPYDIFTANARPTAFVMHPRTLQNIALLKDANGRYLFTDNSVWGGPQVQVTKDGFTYPSAAVGKLLGYPVYLSTQISITRTQGSSSSATNIYYGDFSKVLIFERQAADIFTSAHYAMNADQTAVRVTARTGLGILQPKAIAAATGII